MEEHIPLKREVWKIMDSKKWLEKDDTSMLELHPTQ